jgi:hypothetical protein
MPRYYALTSTHGSATSVGPDNTFGALVFDSKADRGAYIGEHQSSSLVIKAINREEALKFATRNAGAYYLPRPNGELVKVK